MAALVGAGCPEWREKTFLAFHVSGGTTDALLVEPSADSGLNADEKRKNPRFSQRNGGFEKKIAYFQKNFLKSLEISEKIC